MARLISGTCILASEDWPLSIEALSEGHFLNTANFGRVQGKCPFKPIIYNFFLRTLKRCNFCNGHKIK